jgi:hypothetical protein
MTTFSMWCNGFLQTLEFRPRTLAQLFPVKMRRPLQRVTLDNRGRWNLEFACDDRREAVLSAGWIACRGRVIGLVWTTSKGRNIRAWAFSGDHDPETWRRLFVRLRHPKLA